ncbi:MAG: CoA-binding protein [Desulfovibrio sp.]
MLYDDRVIAELLRATKTIAIVGAKDKKGSPVDMVGRYLIHAGYTVIPVHPKRQNVWGLKTYTSLAEIPDHIDMINLFRAATYCPDHAREALALSSAPRAFWMQSGIVSAEAEALLNESGIAVIQDRCTKIEHERLL